MKYLFKLLFRLILGFISILLLLLLLISSFLFIPSVQEYVSQNIGTYLTDKVGTQVRLNAIYLDFPSGISIEELYIEDKSSDTLLYAGNLDITIDYFALLHAEVEVSHILLENSAVNIEIREDSSFNFDFIIDSFKTNSNVEETEDTSSLSKLSFDVGIIKLNDVRFSYISNPDGILTSYSIGHLIIDVNTFDIEDQIYIANEIDLTDSKGSFESIMNTKSSNTPTSNTNPIGLTVGSKEINISNTSFYFNDRTEETSFQSEIGDLTLSIDSINLAKSSIVLNELFIAKSEVKVSINSGLAKDSPENIKTKSNETESLPFNITTKSFGLSDFSFHFDDISEKKVEKGIDYAHINLLVNRLESEDIYFNGIKNLGMNLKDFNANESSGLTISKASLDLKLDSSRLIFNKLYVKTNASTIDAYAELKFESLEEINKKLEELLIDLRFNKSSIGLSDALFFAPDLASNNSLENLLAQKVVLDGRIFGSIDQIEFREILLKTAKSTSLKLNGVISGLPNKDELNFSFKEIKLKTSKSDFNPYLPDTLIPPSISLPNNLAIDLDFFGSLNNFGTKINLCSSYGKILSELAFQRVDSLTDYQLIIDIPQFDVASLLQDTALNNLAFCADINGKGLKLKEMELDVSAILSDFDYLNYRYSDLNINGLIQDEFFKGNVNMKDSNLVFDFKGFANLDSTLPKFNFNFSLEGIDLQNLNISQEDYRIKGGIQANIEGNTLENLNGDLNIRNIFLIYEGNQYEIDSLLFVSIIDSGKTDISINSNLFDASFKGNIYLSDLGESIKKYLSDQLNSQSSSELTKAQDFVFDLQIKDPDILTEVILPELKSFQTGKIHGEFDNQQELLAIDVNFPRIDYSGLIIDSLNISINSEPEKIKSSISIHQVGYDTLSVNNISLSSELSEKEAVINFSVLNSLEEKLLQLAGSLTKQEAEYRFRFLEDQQYFNKLNWVVNPSNLIYFGDSIAFKEVNFSKKNQSFGIQTENGLHKLNFSNFELASLFNVIGKSNENISNYALRQKEINTKKPVQLTPPDSTRTSIIDGLVNGRVHFPIDSNNFIKAEFEIENLKFKGVVLGNLESNYFQLQEKDSIEVYLSSDENELDLNGYFNDENINFDLNIKKLHLKTLEVFTNRQITNSEGFLTAEANLFKQGESYNSKGKIGFQNISFKSSFLGEKFYLDNESLSFSKENIVFNQFTVLDSSKNPFKINGKVGIKNLTNPSFNLEVDIDDFQFLNTTKKSANDLFYGTVISSANLLITGNLDKPKVKSSLRLESGTDLTFVVPEGEATEVNREGIVEFVDKDDKIPFLLRKDKKANTSNLDILGIDFSSVIKIDDNTKLTIVIDPITGDRLKIQGGGELRADVNPRGNVELNGIYTIINGDYELKLYNIVQRKFTLNNGSSLIWNGDPLEAKMDITGTYLTKASPLGLLESETTSLTDAERSKYKKRIPFKVLLLLKGELFQPDIAFKIELPEEVKSTADGAVTTKLTQLNEDESELNKQVFSLIIFKRFYSSDPFGGTGGGSYAARESVSQILSQQLNNLSDKYVKGFEMEVNVDSYSDYNTNGNLDGNTDVSLAMSKTLFDDRVVVRVDGDFAVENNNNTQPTSSNAVSGDVSVEYNITEDGKYKLKLYRKDGYDGIIEGEFIETGISVIYTKEFKKLRDLFKPSDEMTNSN